MAPRKTKRRNSSNSVSLPSLVKVFQLPCSAQAEIYAKAAVQLDPKARGDIRRRGAFLFPVKDIEPFLAAIKAHWERERQRCIDDPSYFKWPSTQAEFGDGSFSDRELEQDGVLRRFGYSVSSETQLSDAERAARLDVVFRAPIPPFMEWHKVLEWGEPETATRLKKMANCLAAFARNGARRSADWMRGPVERWKIDLEYLRARYYDKHFGFDWPETL